MGAWIETQLGAFERDSNQVAPRVGAWIETYVLPLVDVQPMSPLAWGRGLKLC